MSKNKHKKTDTKVKDSKFIRFSKIQSSLLREIRNRQVEEINVAVALIYDDLGITEEVLKALPGTYVLRQDCSGTDVIPPPLDPPAPDPPVEDPKDIKPPEKETEPQK